MNAVVRCYRGTDQSAVERILHEAALNVDLMAECTNPYAQLWVAEFEPGCAVAVAVTRRAGDELELVDLATLTQQRRLGAARALISAIVRQAKADQLSALHLEVRASNTAARSLYESLGFSQTRIRRAYYGNGEDAIAMMKALSGDG